MHCKALAFSLKTVAVCAYHGMFYSTRQKKIYSDLFKTLKNIQRHHRVFVYEFTSGDGQASLDGHVEEKIRIIL